MADRLETVKALSKMSEEIHVIDSALAKIYSWDRKRKLSIIGMQQTFRESFEGSDKKFVDDSFNFEAKLLQLIKPAYESLLKEYEEHLCERRKILERKIDEALKIEHS